jgi:phosphonoacetaldehyde hydrolase
MMNFVFHRSYRHPVKAVILDWAGTTMDYGCYAPAVVFIEVFKRHGVEITMAEAREPMGAHKKVHIRAISQNPAVGERWRDVHGRACSEDDVEAMFQEFIPLQLDCLADYAELIPGTLEALVLFRNRGLKIGSTTGYTGEMMELLLAEAKKRGYAPDSTVCATDVPAGRPEPWMCLRNAQNLGVYPMEAIIKIGDTLPDIEEGLNAGMWTIGLAKTGNEMGLNGREIDALDPEDIDQRLTRARKRMAQTGAHYVVDGIWDCDPLIDAINARLARGDTP